MKMLEVDKRAARKLCGISETDSGCCPVVLVSGSATPRLISVPGYYVDAAGDWIYTPGVDYGRCLLGYRYVPGTRVIEVSESWMLRLRSGPMVNQKKLTIELTPTEQQVCRTDAMAVEAPPYDVVLVPGYSPPAWEDCDAYWLDSDGEHPIRTEIHILVGRQYIQSLRDQEVRDETERK